MPLRTITQTLPKRKMFSAGPWRYEAVGQCICDLLNYHRKYSSAPEERGLFPGNFAIGNTESTAVLPATLTGTPEAAI